MMSQNVERGGADLAKLTPNQQRALLAQLLQERAAKQNAASSDTFAMSLGQQGLWYAYCRDPHATPFNVFLPARMRANLDLSALQKSINYLASRHACLRTTFTDEGGELQQVVHEQLQPEFKVIDARHLAGDVTQLQTLISAESQRPFNLQQGPLLRMAAFQLASDDYVVLATTHHIVVDFWSLILMLAELREIYPNLAAGRAPALPLESNNYAEFVADQRAMLDGPASERLKAYWLKQLRTAPTTLELLTDFERPKAFTGRAAIQPLDILSQVSERVFQLAASARTTPFVVIHAAIQVLLHQCTGQNEFLIGSPFSGRSHRKFEATVGFFVNMLPLRADVRDEPSFLAVIERTNTALLEALEFEAYPFSAIVRDINPPRDASRSPLFQVSCTFEKAQLRSEAGRAGFLFPGEHEQASLAGLQQESFYVPQQTCHYDLEFIFEQTERGLRGMICYCRDLFSNDSMQSMAENFVRLLDELLSDPERSVADSSAISVPARLKTEPTNNELTVRGIATGPTTASEMLERVAAAQPNDAALRGGGARWTYRELMQCIGGYASRLISSEIASDAHGNPSEQMVVPVIGPSSAETLIAILGAMSSGAAVVPIDSAQPAVTRQDLLADTQGCQILEFPFSSFAAAEFKSQCKPEDLAYIIYTSGSTGRPKGVMIEHRAICNTLSWRHAAVPLHAGDRVLMLLSHQFDAGLGVALATLTQGAELVWADAESRHDVQSLIEQIIRDRITVLPAIPSLLRLVIEHPKFRDCGELRMLWTGGEAMPRELPKLVKQRTNAELWNFYGPTEAAVEAIANRVESHDVRCSVPLGFPIAGVDVFVVDSGLRILPDTMPGELAITGRGLARGYLNLPELTNERFVELRMVNGDRNANAFRDEGADERPEQRQGGEESVRAYLTGDRGRRLRNGQFEFLGRADYQVKVRGYRIELEEIEQHLIANPLVAQAVVTVVEPDSMAAQLVAYVRLREPLGDKAEEQVEDQVEVGSLIRQDLASRLPAYKVPVQVIVLDAFPMTSSGKVDRKRLPSVTIRATERIVTAPRTPLEAYLAAAWCESLKLESVSVDQNFFDLGGSSLRAAMLTAKLTEGLGVHVPTSLLFDLADISQVAQRLVQLYEVQMAQRFGAGAVTFYASRGMLSNDLNRTSVGRYSERSLHPLLAPLKWIGDRRPIFMVHPPGGIVMCYRELAARVDPQQPLIAIRSRGVQGDEPLPQSIEEAAADYIAGVRTVQAKGPYRLGGWSLGGLFALEMAMQLHASGEQVEQLLLLDTAIPDGASHLVPAEELVNAGSEYGVNLSLSELNALHPDEQLPLLWQHAKSLGILQDETPPEVVAQVLRDLKSLFHHHMELATRYQVRPYPGEITLIRPTEVPFEQRIAPDRGWRFVANRVTVRYVSGHHHSMVQLPHVIELAAQIELPHHASTKNTAARSGTR